MLICVSLSGIPALLSSLLSVACYAQTVGVYAFENNFKESSGNLPELTVVGCQGSFVKEALPELGNMNKTVYRFNKNCGLSFDNAAAGYFFGHTYSIEIYFKFDDLKSWRRVIDFKNRTEDNGAYIYDGRLNFYDFVKSDVAPVVAGEYTHYVFTRDGATKKVKIYADGVGKIEFIDVNNHAVISTDNKLNFFYDDLKVNHEASSGAVALIKLYDYLLDQKQVQQTYAELKKNISAVSSNIAEPVTTKSYLNITVTDSKTQKPVNAEVYIQSPSGTLRPQKGNTTNQYLHEIELNKNYTLTVKAKGYLIHTEQIHTSSAAPINKNIALAPITVGQNIQLKDVLFVQSKPELLEESYPELDKLVLLLKEYPNMKIELSGHTDNLGNPKDNLELSEKRVQTVKNYLTSKGIEASRISGKGYGGSRPIYNTTDPEKRKLNRRVEFKIISY
ncbi:MAG: OmpA family protein [Cytophagaceae bacterium]|nr:OmpA family protein [Cytophagaceae bacterium]MDW8455467.1 OmpA family protein [Cytophagaceae bacterium]